MRARTYGQSTHAWLDDTFDLRRRRESALSETVARRAHWLDPDDRELVLAMFRDNRPAKAIAAMVHDDPRHIRRRLRRLARRLLDPRVAYVVAHRNAWSPSRQAVAHMLYIQGRPMRQVSDKLGMTLYSVRQHRDAIEAMIRAPSKRQQASPSRTWKTAESTPAERKPS